MDLKSSNDIYIYTRIYIYFLIVVFLLRGLHRSGLHHHLDLVLGACQQLDGAGLAETGSVHLEEDGPLVGLDA